MQAYRLESVIEPDGKLTLQNLPLPEGERVEVIILVSPAIEKTGKYPLRDTAPYRYDDPFEPAIPEEDWEALK